MRWMKGQRARPLVAINGVLVCALGATYVLEPERVTGQPGGAARARGEYTMISARATTGGTADIVYILDSINQELVSVRWDAARQSLGPVGYRNLMTDGTAQPGR